MFEFDRRALRVAAVSEYTEVILAGKFIYLFIFNSYLFILFFITVAITEWQEIGSVVVYRVISRWRFSRACVLMQFSDFKKLHGYYISIH